MIGRSLFKSEYTFSPVAVLRGEGAMAPGPAILVTQKGPAPKGKISRIFHFK